MRAEEEFIGRLDLGSWEGWCFVEMAWWGGEWGLCVDAALSWSVA